MTSDPAVLAVAAVRAGDVVALKTLLQQEPDLAVARLGAADAGRTLLHGATDWPGHAPNVASIIHLLVDSGADVNAAFQGAHAETPLHLAASCGDVVAIDALLDAGANIDARGGSVGDGTGTPLFDATVFGQWAAAVRLLERGAPTGGWEEAVLGLTEPLTERLGSESVTQRDCDSWFWAACHGGQRSSAELLQSAGAERDRPAAWDGLTPLDAALRSAAEGLRGQMRSSAGCWTSAQRPPPSAMASSADRALRQRVCMASPVVRVIQAGTARIQMV